MVKNVSVEYWRNIEEVNLYSKVKIILQIGSLPKNDKSKSVECTFLESFLSDFKRNVKPHLN